MEKLFTFHSSLSFILISIVFSLIGSLYLHTDIVGLSLCECGEVYANLLKVKAGNLLIKMLGQAIYINRIVLAEKLNLRQSLIGE